MRTCFFALLISAFQLFSVSAFAQTNVLTGTVADYGLRAQSRVTVRLTLQYPNPRTYGTALIRQDPITTATATNGTFAFTNILWGRYSLSVDGLTGTPFTLYVGTNTLGSVPIASLATNQNALPMNSATNYPTLSQVNALIQNATNGITGGSGTTYTNRGDLPAGVIVGGAVGTNDTLPSYALTNNHTGLVRFRNATTQFGEEGASAALSLFDDGPEVGAFKGITSINGSLFYDGRNISEQLAGVTNYLPASGVLAAIAFRESRLGFPGVDVEEAGRFIYSYDYGKSWKGGMGYPHFRSAKAGWGLRDPALVEVGNNLAVAFTESTNSIGRTNFPIYASTGNYSYWPLATNISMSLAGETVTTNWYQWSPVFTVDGGTVYLFGSVNTNGGTNGAVGSWETRYKTTTTNLFPYGWSATSRTTNNTGATNILDLTPFQDTNGLWSAWYKNEASTGANAKRVQLGRFEGGPGTAFSDVLTGDFVSIAGQLWNANVEGNWMVQLPDGRYRVFMTRYSQADYNYNGEGRMLCYAETGAGTAYTNAASWSLLTNATVVFYCQSFKPIRLSSPAKIANWIALTEGQNYMRGQVNIMPEIGVSGPSGLTKFGWAYTNPYPADSYSGIFTNDHAGVRFGVHGQGGGIYGLSDRSVRLWVPTLTSSDANWALPEFAKDILTLTSNSVSFAAGVPISGNFIGATNLNASNLASGTVPSARMGTTNAATNTTTSYALVMHGTNTPVWANVLSNATFVNTVLIGPTTNLLTLVIGGNSAAANSSSLTVASNSFQFAGNFGTWMRTSMPAQGASGTNAMGAGWRLAWYNNSDIASGSPELTLSRSAAWTLGVSSNVAALGSFIVGNTQPTTNGLGSQGGIIGCNGTNWWTVMRNSAGGLATNKLTLEAWP